MFSVVVELEYYDYVFFDCNDHCPGDIDYFHLFLTGGSFSEAYDRIVSYCIDNFPFCDCRIISIIRIK